MCVGGGMVGERERERQENSFGFGLQLGRSRSIVDVMCKEDTTGLKSKIAPIGTEY